MAALTIAGFTAAPCRGQPSANIFQYLHPKKAVIGIHTYTDAGKALPSLARRAAYKALRNPVLTPNLGRIRHLSPPARRRIPQHAQGGFRLSKNAPIPSRASSPSQQEINSPTLWSITP